MESYEVIDEIVRRFGVEKKALVEMTQNLLRSALNEPVEDLLWRLMAGLHKGGYRIVRSSEDPTMETTKWINGIRRLH